MAMLDEAGNSGLWAATCSLTRHEPREGKAHWPEEQEAVQNAQESVSGLARGAGDWPGRLSSLFPREVLS